MNSFAREFPSSSQESSDAQNPFSVSHLTTLIKQQLELSFPEVWVQGEVSNFKKQSSGHLYFSLKDTGAQVTAVCFRGSASKLAQLPKEGDKVIVRAEVNVYPLRGNYQLLVKELLFTGIGELLLRLEQLKKEIHRRGWFATKHKKPLPKFPRTIGVITSPTGAAIRDMLHVLQRRFAGFHLLLSPVKVQGKGAAEEIAQAIDEMNHYQLADVLIVGRGGGSVEDLWAFNEEIVARALFESHIPVIAAVGHETDHCIAEYVADVRAPTPSAAAEIVIAEKQHQLDTLASYEKRTAAFLMGLLQRKRELFLRLCRHPLLLSPYRLLSPLVQQCDELRPQLDRALQQQLQQKRLRLSALVQRHQALKPTQQIVQQRLYLQHLQQNLERLLRNDMEQKRERLAVLWGRIQQAMGNTLALKKKSFSPVATQQQLKSLIQRFLGLRKERLLNLARNLQSIDPKNLLRKGYSIVFSEKDGSAIVSKQSVQKQEQIRILLSDGELLATINEVRP